MQTFTKRITFERLPAIEADPVSWRRHLNRHWGAGQGWVEPPFVPVAELRRLLGAHLPELLPAFEALLPSAGAWPGAEQLLALYNLRPFWAGCSQTIGRRTDRVTLLRNYDLGLDDCPCALRFEALAEGGWILGSAEGGWGYLDGLNDRGLAIALTFGGRFEVGPGFSIPLVVRWLLQTCATVDEAVKKLVANQVPHRVAQNLLLVDRSGAHATLYLSPDRGVEVAEGLVSCTNHQGVAPAGEAARFTQTVERLQHLEAAAGGLTLADLLRPPLYRQHYLQHFGTLYSVEYDPVGQTAHFAWPERSLLLTPNSEETSFEVTYQQAAD